MIGGCRVTSLICSVPSGVVVGLARGAREVEAVAVPVADARPCERPAPRPGAQGRAEGRAEGSAEGSAESRAQGRAQGRAQASTSALVPRRSTARTARRASKAKNIRASRGHVLCLRAACANVRHESCATVRGRSARCRWSRRRRPRRRTAWRLGSCQSYSPVRGTSRGTAAPRRPARGG